MKRIDAYDENIHYIFYPEDNITSFNVFVFIQSEDDKRIIAEGNIISCNLVYEYYPKNDSNEINLIDTEKDYLIHAKLAYIDFNHRLVVKDHCFLIKLIYEELIEDYVFKYLKTFSQEKLFKWL